MAKIIRLSPDKAKKTPTVSPTDISDLDVSFALDLEIDTPEQTGFKGSFHLKSGETSLSCQFSIDQCTAKPG